MIERKAQTSLTSVYHAENDHKFLKNFIAESNDNNIDRCVETFMKSGASKEYIERVKQAYKDYKKVNTTNKVSTSINPGSAGMLISFSYRTYKEQSGISAKEKEKILENMLKWSHEKRHERIHGEKVLFNPKSIASEYKNLRKHGVTSAFENDSIMALSENTINETKETLQKMRTKKSLDPEAFQKEQIELATKTPYDRKADRLIATRRFLFETKHLGIDKAYQNMQGKIREMELLSKSYFEAGMVKESDKMKLTAVNMGAAVTKFYRESKPYEATNTQGNQNEAGFSAGKLFTVAFGRKADRAAELLSAAYGSNTDLENKNSSQIYSSKVIKNEAKELISGIMPAHSLAYELSYNKIREIGTELNIEVAAQHKEQYEKMKGRETKVSQSKGREASMEIDFKSDAKKNAVADENLVVKKKKPFLKTINPALVIAPPMLPAPGQQNISQGLNQP